MQKPAKLNNSQIRFLKARAHNLNPVVMIGNKGLSEGVIAELCIALETHELIKIKLPGGEKADRLALLNAACAASNAAFVAMIGRVGIVFKAAEKTNFALP